jgi:alkylation response protein AidB-like acyl-CoA dehydrogenase
MMDGLTEEESAIVSLVGEFVDREVRPVAQELEHATTYPEKLIDQIKLMGRSPASALRRPPLRLRTACRHGGRHGETVRVRGGDGDRAERVRIHGGYGYSTEFDVERYFRDSPLMIVGEGTNEILRTVITRQLIKRNRLAS